MIWKWTYGKLSAAKSHTLSLSSLGNALGWGRWPSPAFLLQLYPLITHATQRLSKHVLLRMPILTCFVRRKALRQLCEVLGVEVGLTSAMIAIGLKLIEPWWNTGTMVLWCFVPCGGHFAGYGSWEAVTAILLVSLPYLTGAKEVSKSRLQVVYQMRSSMLLVASDMVIWYRS